MILQRLATSIRKQDWFTVLIETLIVVLGVFLGIQLGNWNEARADLRRGTEFTEQLREDLRMEAWGYARLIEYNTDVLAAAEAAVSALEGNSELSDEALLINAYVATQYLNHHRSNATYEEIKSTGAMGLVADKDLRDLAARMYTTPIFTVIQQEGAQSTYRARFRMIVPSNVQSALGSACGDRVGERGNFEQIKDMIGYPCETGLAPDVIARSAAILRSDDLLLQELRRRVSDLKTALGNLLQNSEDILEGLRSLVEEMP